MLLKEQKREYTWSPMAWATLLVGAYIILIAYGVAGVATWSILGSHIVDTTVDVIEIIALLVAQKAINIAHDDPTGTTNSKVTAANYAWILIGLIMWAMYLITVADELRWIDLDIWLQLIYS